MRKSKVLILRFSFQPETERFPSLASNPKAILFLNLSQASFFVSKFPRNLLPWLVLIETKYLLVKDSYRGVNISRNLNTYDPAYTDSDKPLEFKKGVKGPENVLNYKIIWYSGDELADLKGSNSEVITNYATDGIDILKRTPNTGQVDPTPTGTGVGECWFPLEIQEMPNFRNIDNLYSTLDLNNDTKDVFDSIEGNAVGIKDLGSANKKAKMDAIKRKIVENSSKGDFLYYNIGDIGTQECEAPEDSLVNTSYAWIDKIGSS